MAMKPRMSIYPPEREKEEVRDHQYRRTIAILHTLDCALLSSLCKRVTAVDVFRCDTQEYRAVGRSEF